MRLPWGFLFLIVILLSLVACDQPESAALPTALPTLPTEATAMPEPTPTSAVTVLAETAEARPTSDIPDYSGPAVGPTTTATTAAATAATATVTPTAAPAAVSQPTAAAATDEGEVELEDFQFVPRVLTVRVGTEVKFSNKDREVHTVTSDTRVFDSGSLSRGEEFYYTFTQAGEYPYYCAPHGGPGGRGMAGTIIVVP